MGSATTSDQQQQQQQPLFHPGEQPGGRRSPREPSHFNMAVFPQLAGLDPFERWLLLGPEHEAATVKAIHEAIEEDERQQQAASASLSPGEPPPARTGRRTVPAYKVIKRTRSQRSWPSSLEIRSYAANKYSVKSDDWKPSNKVTTTTTSVVDGGGAKSVDYVGPSKPARRHRRSEPSLGGSSVRGLQRAVSLGGDRLPPNFSLSHNNTNTNNNNNNKTVASPGPKRRFQCTFCPDAFVKRHDWQRHEKSQHLALEWWTCCPDDGLAATHIDPLTAVVTCVFCGIRDPDRQHLDGQHGLAACAARSVAERTFYRKDHLRQHLRLMHAECPFTQAMEAWKTELVEVKSRCGFCGAEFETWPARVNHLAAHFRAGATMERWQGDWGLEPAVAENLERATLPADRAPLAAAAAPVSMPQSPAAPAPGNNITSWPGMDDSPMQEIDGFRFDSSLAANVPLAPPSIMSDTSGLPWDLSLFDLDTLPSMSVLDPFDEYSFSAASALDFFGHDHYGNLQQQQQHLFNDMMLPLTTPPIQEGNETPFPQQTPPPPLPLLHLGGGGYDGPTSALLGFADMPQLGDPFAQLQLQQQHPHQNLFNTETFLGVPPYYTEDDYCSVDGTTAAAAEMAAGGGVGVDNTTVAPAALHVDDQEENSSFGKLVL
ncbi:uncharacterized protein B0I36DRAFT_331636 [Microdochium trichocladiopsis]|uniref:C2H2-type domain-containing protein n=1 Tax=Microdochium trichocladiopsis TaxID=1682393 RepID=A0A9P9BLM6_9PEZI|nr:uncharacterized protein B0I36DRAFT_331636 [Microdochium trichocladiopsis]KAH7024565.1 hypothetical protein B0I36DRAFT_331636 [Microdochium trichocladiopsis]